MYGSEKKHGLPIQSQVELERHLLLIASFFNDQKQIFKVIAWPMVPLNSGVLVFKHVSQILENGFLFVFM